LKNCKVLFAVERLIFKSFFNLIFVLFVFFSCKNALANMKLLAVIVLCCVYVRAAVSIPSGGSFSSLFASNTGETDFNYASGVLYQESGAAIAGF
jgi:hypothetical protein